LLQFKALSHMDGHVYVTSCHHAKVGTSALGFGGCSCHERGRYLVATEKTVNNQLLESIAAKGSTEAIFTDTDRALRHDDGTSSYGF
jgi:hypothetical protein